MNQNKLLYNIVKHASMEKQAKSIIMNLIKGFMKKKPSGVPSSTSNNIRRSVTRGNDGRIVEHTYLPDGGRIIRDSKGHYREMPSPYQTNPQTNPTTKFPIKTRDAAIGAGGAVAGSALLDNE